MKFLSPVSQIRQGNFLIMAKDIIKATSHEVKQGLSESPTFSFGVINEMSSYVATSASEESLAGTPALSETAREVMNVIKNLKNKSAHALLTNYQPVLPDTKSLDEYLFDARANVKIIASKVSMHIKSELREKLFRQIDLLHDVDEWAPDDIPINPLSFECFLAGFMQINPERGPGLGLSHTGNTIASWTPDGDRLIIEFLPNHYVSWVLTRFIGNEQERFSGYTKVNRLFKSLSSYEPEHWFSKKN